MLKSEELKAVPIFACLSDAQRERIAQTAADLQVSKGEWLIREGERPWFFVLLEGSLEAEKEYGGSLHAVKSRYCPGDFYGETPILLDSPTIASLRAREPSRVLRLDRLQFKELIDCSPECSALIFQVMSRRVTMIRDHTRDHNAVRVLIVGTQNDSPCREVRMFLSLNHIPFEWVDPIRNPERIPAAMQEERGSFVVVDSTALVAQPLTVRRVAEALDIRTRPEQVQYDVVVIGGGPAGLAAAVYGASEGLSVLLLERNATGGQAGTSSRIENYLGFPNGISGDELSEQALRQATRFGAEIVMTREVEAIISVTGGYCVHFDGGQKIESRTVILATGVEWRRLEAEGLDSLMGKGVLYGAARTEAPTVVGKKVFIVGGGNSAGQAAMFFSSYASSVTILIRGDGLAKTMSQYLIDQLAQRPNISVESHTKVLSVQGGDVLTSIWTVAADHAAQKRSADALFIMIGAKARTDWLPELIQRDTNGFICTGRDVADSTGQRTPFLLETSLPGIFCAGDVRHDSIKRVASGVGEGSMAIAFVHQFLELDKQQPARAS